MASYEYNKEYAKKYISQQDELKIRIPKGQKQAVEAHAKSRGESINGMVNRVILADMGLETWPKIPQDKEG